MPLMHSTAKLTSHGIVIGKLLGFTVSKDFNGGLPVAREEWPLQNPPTVSIQLLMTPKEQALFKVITRLHGLDFQIVVEKVCYSITGQHYVINGLPNIIPATDSDLEVNIEVHSAEVSIYAPK